MVTQITIEFEVLKPQNNRESEEILFNNEKHLRGQVKTVYEAMLRGERLTTGEALLKYGIGDLRARIRDIRNAGIIVKDKLLKGRYKEYYL